MDHSANRWERGTVAALLPVPRETRAALALCYDHIAGSTGHDTANIVPDAQPHDGLSARFHRADTMAEPG
jgi:hypothetical protein